MVIPEIRVEKSEIEEKGYEEGEDRQQENGAVSKGAEFVWYHVINIMFEKYNKRVIQIKLYNLIVTYHNNEGVSFSQSSI